MDADGPTLAEAVLALREHVGLFQAAGVLLEAVEAAGGIAEMVHELEQERDLLEIEVATLRREQQRQAGGPGERRADMMSEQANQKASELTRAQAEAPQYSQISVEPIAPDGSPDEGYRVVGRDKDDFSKYHELAR